MGGLSRATLALALGAAAFAIVLAGSLVLVGAAGDDPAGAEGMPYAGFEFEETTISVEADGRSSWRAVQMTYRGGVDLPRGAVVVWVNGNRGWDLDDGNRTAPVWDDGGRLSDGPARVVVVGDDVRRDEPADPPAVDVGADRLRPIKEGDVIEIVWIESGGDRMTVLQRYVVGGE